MSRLISIRGSYNIYFVSSRYKKKYYLTFSMILGHIQKNMIIFVAKMPIFSCQNGEPVDLSGVLYVTLVLSNVFYVFF